ncbi:phenylacetate--CoA ligase family protein [Anaerosinus massiliensis]|uniref:phenylacetate--CoA ligase family protein n=1 Tax=Massilibacillus massiliensis TaxID=1806837 RepID=UPI000AD3563E|nr:AMP-binding protein [Massilibacillus massiliensis]
MYCNHEIETMSRDAMIELQTKKLQNMIKWAYEKSPFYKEKMSLIGLNDRSVKTLDDLKKFPFTTREDLFVNSPFGFLAVPLSSTIRMRMIGQNRPITKAYTSGDIGRNVEMTARALVAGGVTMATALQICEDYTCEHSLGIHYAAEVLGATVIPSELAKLDRQWEMIDKFRVTAIASNAQQMLQLLVAGQALNYDLENSSISTIFSLNQDTKNSMDEHIASRFHAKIFNLYSPPEFGASAMMFECNKKAGLHIQEDYYYPEIVHITDTGDVASGQMGELVLTALAADAMPLIRYRTGQIVAIDSEPCACGRTFARIKIP